MYYNPNCAFRKSYRNDAIPKPAGTVYNVAPTMCANFLYDLNGKKGPNEIGKDIGFITAFYPTDSKIANPQIIGTHKLPNTDFNFSAYCRAKHGDDSRNATRAELEAIFVSGLVAFGDGVVTIDGEVMPHFLMNIGEVTDYSKDHNYNYFMIICVKK